MKLKIYAYKSAEKGCYSQPKFVPYSKEDMISELKRSLIGLDKNTAESVKDLTLVYLGIFDDTEGKIVYEKEELIALDPHIRIKEVSDERSK